MNYKTRKTFPWHTSRRYNAYVDHLKQLFGSRVQKVIVDAGFTCPNRDGSKGYNGCLYCNNDSFTPKYRRPDMNIREQVEIGIDYVSSRYKVDKFMVYFQPYSNTYASLEQLQKLYEQALMHPQVIGISIGTRPDCIDREKIDYLEELAKTYYVTIEYGLESPYDRTLKWINRKHDFNCWVKAVEMTSGRGIYICTHIILGFPNESKNEMLETARIISHFPFDYLKIHHLQVVDKTILATRYKEKPFHLFDYEEYIDLLVDFLQYLRPDIVIQRLVGETNPKFLIERDWVVRADTVQKHIQQEMEIRDVWQGKLYNFR